MASILGIIAFILFIVGIVKAIHGEWAGWIVCWVIAAAIGPGGWYIFR